MQGKCIQRILWMFCHQKSEKEQSSVEFIYCQTTQNTHFVDFDLNWDKISAFAMVFEYMYFWNFLADLD